MKLLFSLTRSNPWFPALFACFGALFVGRLAAAPEGQEFPASVGVYVWTEVLPSNAGAAVSLTATSEIDWQKEGTDLQSTNINLNGSTPGADGWVRDTQPAWLPITTDEQISYHDFAGTNVSQYRFHVVAPAGYAVYFYNPTTGNFYESSVLTADLSTTQLLFIVKPKGERGALAGKASDVTPGETNLRIALGYLPNGESAGYLDFDPVERQGARDALGNFFLLYSYFPNGYSIDYRLDLPGRQAGPFYCNSTSDDVKVVCQPYTDPSTGRTYQHVHQVLAPQALIDIELQSDQSTYVASFYPRSVVASAGNGGYTFSGAPFVTYTIASGGNSNAWSCNVTRTEGNWTTTASISSAQAQETITLQQYGAAPCLGYAQICNGANYDCSYDIVHHDTVTVKNCAYVPVTECGWDYEVECDWYGDCWIDEYPYCYTTSVLSCTYTQEPYVWTEHVQQTCFNPCAFTTQGDCNNWGPDPVDTYQLTVYTSRGTTTVQGFNGSRTETAISYNSLYPSTQHFNGDSYTASDTGSSEVLVGRYGAAVGSHVLGPDSLNPYTTPYYTSPYETVFALQQEATDLDALSPDFANSAIGYTTHRKYYDVFNFDPNATQYPGRLFYEYLPDRSWIMYGYYDASNLDKVGLTRRILTPYGDTARPSTVDDTGGGYRAQVIDYAPDWDGAYTLPASTQLWANNTQLTSTTYQYASAGTANGQPLWQVSSSDLSNATNQAVTSQTKIYQGVGVGSLYRNQPYSIQAANGRKQCFAYEPGDFDSTDAFVYDASGGAIRTTVVTGLASGSTTALDGCNATIDTIGLVDSVSTRDVTIRDERGFVVRTEGYVYSGGSWVLLTWANMTYSDAGNLLNRQASNGAVYEAEYTDINAGSTGYSGIVFTNNGNATGRKQYDKDERGVITQYSYDSLGRVSATLQLSIPAADNVSRALPALNTAFLYNSDNRIVEKDVGPSGGERYVTKCQYDFSGRLTSETVQGQTTAYAYNLLPTGQYQSVTETRPDGTTVITTTNRDGTLISKTGTGVVPTYYTYAVDSAQETVTTFIGSSNSPRWQKTWVDGFGRTLKQESPASGGNGTLDVTYTYDSNGQLIKTQTGSLAPVLYVYDDPLYSSTQQGLDLDGDGQLGVNDRRVHHLSNFALRHGDWWKYSETDTYLDDGTTVPMSKTWVRLTGFTGASVPSSTGLSVAGSVLGETIAQDADGNESENFIYVDRANGAQSSVDVSPLAAQASVTSMLGGEPVKTVSASGTDTELGLDALHRVIRIYDRTRTNDTGVNLDYVSGTERVQDACDNLNNLVARYTYDAAGRVREEDKPLISYTAAGQPGAYNSTNTTKTCYQYNPLGQVTNVWGDTAYPVKYVYDNYGDRVAQFTYRNFPAWDVEQPALGTDPSFWPSSGDTTLFANYPETGLLQTRTDADGKAVNYTYNALGQLAQRTWARGVSTKYAYATSDGALTGISYSDTTPAVNYAYDRLGRPTTVQDATGYRTFTYRPDLQPDKELFGYNGTNAASSMYGTNLEIDSAYGAMNSASSVPIGFDLVDSGNSAYSYRISLDSQTGRLANITTDAGTYTIGYLPNSDLLSSITNTNPGGSAWSQVRAYETQRDLLQSISTTNGGANVIAQYNFQNDVLGRPYEIDQTGALFAPYITAQGPAPLTASSQAVINQYSYDARSQVTAAVTSIGAPSGSMNPLTGRNFGFAYDTVGNRVQENINGTAQSYTPNELNQYTARQTPSTVPVSGTASSGAHVSIDGSPLTTSEWQNQFFYRAIPKSPAAGGLQHIQVNALPSGPIPVNGTNQGYTTTTFAWAHPKAENFTYDADGNLTGDGLWNYAYDAENRLSGVYSLYADETGRRLAVLFTYDFESRRVAKCVYDYDGAKPTTCRSQHLYVYQDQSIMAEYAASPTDGTRQGLIRTCTWGPDISGDVEGAGGVGGLLALKDYSSTSAGVYQAAYDGNGNLTALTDTNGVVQAAYEYDPYGNTVRASGAYASENPFRFSTKFYDTETGLYNYGYRYYSSSIGRFLGRDPIEESGGLNIYSLAANNPISGSDPDGLDPDGNFVYGGGGDGGIGGDGGDDDGGSGYGGIPGGGPSIGNSSFGGLSGGGGSPGGTVVGYTSGYTTISGGGSQGNVTNGPIGPTGTSYAAPGSAAAVPQPAVPPPPTSQLAGAQGINANTAFSNGIGVIPVDSWNGTSSGYWVSKGPGQVGDYVPTGPAIAQQINASANVTLYSFSNPIAVQSAQEIQPQSLEAFQWQLFKDIYLGLPALTVYQATVGTFKSGASYARNSGAEFAEGDWALGSLNLLAGAGDFASLGLLGYAPVQGMLSPAAESSTAAPLESLGRDGIDVAEGEGDLPEQVHHFATDKNKIFTPQMEAIADKYGLDLDDAWNKELLPHLGRHPNSYHNFVLQGMQRAALEAGSNQKKFLELFELYVKQPIRNNPALLRAAGWQ